MMYNTPSGAKKHRESTEPENHRTTKMFFFFFFFFFFRWASSNLPDSFTMVFAQNSSIFHWAVHQPIAFFQVWSHTRRFRAAHWKTMASITKPFFSHVYAYSQATKCNYYARFAEVAKLEILLVCGECLKKKPVILQPILHRKPVRGDLLLCDRWQTSAQACICC